MQALLLIEELEELAQADADLVGVHAIQNLAAIPPPKVAVDHPPRHVFQAFHVGVVRQEVDEQPDENVRADIRALPWVRWAFRLDKVSA